ncbi:MAG: efflux RND transporter periplasmic adaptor subunit [Sediminibacterium sp.]
MYKYLISCFFLIILIGCGKKQEKQYPLREDITQSVYASGTIKSKSQYEVYSKVSGIIESILVKEGDVVAKGQTIIQLANTAQSLNYENAKQNALFNSTQSNKEKIEQAKTELELAKSKMDNEASLLTRQEKLWEQEIGTKNELDQRALSFKNASTLYKAAKLKLDDIEKQINFQNSQTNRTAAISAVNMNDFIIKSQVNGKVYTINKQVGELANTQSPIAIIGDANDFYVELQIDEFDINSMSKGLKVLVSMDSHKGEVYEAVIEKIYPIMNERTRTFKADAIFVKRPDNIYPNLSAEANIIIQVKNKALTIPRAYLVEDKYVLLANKEKRKITIGLKDYDKVEVIYGITEKDELVKPE